MRSFQLKAGLEYLRKTHVRRSSLQGCPPADEFFPFVAAVNDVYRAAAVGEADPTGLVEERVRVLKEVEWATERQVQGGIDPPARLDFVRFHRLAAEAELLSVTGRK